MFDLDTLHRMNKAASLAERQGLPWPRANGISISRPIVKRRPLNEKPSRKPAKRGKSR